MNENNNENRNAANPVSQKYQTLDDYMNNLPLSDIEENLAYSMEDTQLVFNKPIFDMAFIITHKSHIEKINNLQNYFQSKFRFTTHCIYLQDLNKLKFCIRDLKLHQISYAVVFNEKYSINNIMDLYILHPIIEIQREMPLDDVVDLVEDDLKNNFEVIHDVMRKKGKPHPVKPNGSECFNMSDQLRYHMCLLSDHRMLELGELENLQRYLEWRKLHLGRAMEEEPGVLEKRPLEACKQERLKYYIYEPIPSDNVVTPNKSHMIPGGQRDLIRFNVSASQSATPTVLPPAIQYPGQHVYEKLVINRAKTISNDFSSQLKQIPGIQLSRGTIKPLSYEIMQGRLTNNQIHKKKDSECMDYSSSDYWINVSLLPENQDVISLSSGSCSPPPMEYDLISITPPSPHSSPSKVELGKRKPESGSQVNKEFMSKLYKTDLMKPEITLKNTPDILINLFRFILNIVPYDLPDNNALLAILNADCNVVQNGIIEPDLKNVNVDYYSCKTNGTVEIIQSIYSIYEVSEKNTEDLTDLQYVWIKYFPDHVSNLSLLVVFYKFIKLLIIFGIFNEQSDRLKLVMNTVEKINAIINFNFEIPILSEKEHLNFKSDLFSKNYMNHDKLHTKYFELPHLSNIPESNKKLDTVIKKKKIEFILGPLLTYFVNTMNSIHKQMQVQQTKIAYNAIRTLRYCLREIYPINLSTTVFNVSKAFSETHECCKEIIDEAKWLLDEFKYYQCVLFTEKHYDFINSLLDFCLRIEDAVKSNPESHRSQSNNDSLFILDAIQFIESFASFDGMTLQYHPETEVSYWKGFLKGSWVNILQKAFQETPLKYEGRPIIKELNNLLPSLWSSRTFDEAVSEATKLNYAEWTNKAQTNPSCSKESFKKVKLVGISWLNNNQLSLKKAVEEFRKYEVMLQNESLCQ